MFPVCFSVSNTLDRFQNTWFSYFFESTNMVLLFKHAFAIDFCGCTTAHKKSFDKSNNQHTDRQTDTQQTRPTHRHTPLWAHGYEADIASYLCLCGLPHLGFIILAFNCLNVFDANKSISQ